MSKLEEWIDGEWTAMPHDDRSPDGPWDVRTGTAWRMGDLTKETAQFLSAAPDLYRAVQAFQARVGCGCGFFACEDCKNADEIAEKAISKARGGL